MTIQLSPEQERAIQEAIKSGVVGSVEEFIEVAIAMLPPARGSKREFPARGYPPHGGVRKKISSQLGEPITRKLLHEGHIHSIE